MPISANRRAILGADNMVVKASPDSKIRADLLRSEIAQLEARYDGLFSPESIPSSKASDGNWLPSIRPLSRTISLH
jgi:hypothetical protein